MGIGSKNDVVVHHKNWKSVIKTCPVLDFKDRAFSDGKYAF